MPFVVYRGPVFRDREVQFATAAQRMLMRALVALLACTTPSRPFVASAARAQDSEPLIQRLSALTERKGYRNAALRDWICNAFEWSTSDCETQMTFQAPYDERDGSVHVFDSVRIPGKPLRIVLIVHDKHSGYGFWTDPDGTLRGCLRSQLADPQYGEWQGAKTSCEDATLKSSFANEMNYWRIQQTALEKAPDRKD
jgi:hypothetical protein